MQTDLKCKHPFYPFLFYALMKDHYYIFGLRGNRSLTCENLGRLDICLPLLYPSKMTLFFTKSNQKTILR